MQLDLVHLLHAHLLAALKAQGIHVNLSKA
jgi:hypothetical protein